MLKYFGFDRIKLVIDTVKFNGGIRSSLYYMYRNNNLPIGVYIGCDSLGNKYYENNNYTFPRNRWVDYAPRFGTDQDGSMICPEWYGWMHHKTDTPPTEKKQLGYSWIMPYEPNQTGTAKQYVPYSTTKPKIEAWVPPKQQ